MNKKDFSNALRKTATTQKGLIDDRFAKADSVLLGMQPEATPAPAKVTADEALLSVVPTDKGTSLNASKEEVMVVRDTFSMPLSDHGLIELIRVRAAREGRNTNKSEVVRAGLRALSSLSSVQLIELLESLERMKPGRK